MIDQPLSVHRLAVLGNMLLTIFSLLPNSANLRSLHAKIKF